LGPAWVPAFAGMTLGMLGRHRGRLPHPYQRANPKTLAGPGPRGYASVSCRPMRDGAGSRKAAFVNNNVQPSGCPRAAIFWSQARSPFATEVSVIPPTLTAASVRAVGSRPGPPGHGSVTPTAQQAALQLNLAHAGFTPGAAILAPRRRDGLELLASLRDKNGPSVWPWRGAGISF
jgi:hypothetical protein